ncbi:putative disease resistance RPP13-like protein 1 [Vicia villosa]|uniref:putative disease resistance RPP13-like protein 1 n=1 Tax=Vicia villosa TaxID=3911 RepID=UPI00273BD0B2|nr:putative disease resistance RPP13-like protein 1 [Vicia villosa]XP_058721751.1 putative disease resistance RPP13-like protein 1 [Vicia villosa]
MDAIQTETLLSLSNSVKLLIQKIVSIDNFPKTKLDVSLLTNLKRTLVDLEDVLYYANNKLVTTQANNKSLNFLTRAVFQVANLLDENHSLRYDDNQNKNHSRLTFFIALIKSKTGSLIQILHGLSSRKQLGYESTIYGRDTDIEKLKHLLLSRDSDGDSKIRVISIVGMGGIGKTTLAQHLYNHPQVNDKFELKVWADFSNDDDDFSVFENALESITSQTTTNDTTEIKTFYPNFLLVLDGVWDARFVNWTLLMDIFNAGETGSRVIVTTRDERIAISMCTFLSVQYLTPLKVEDCWSLLAEHAFGEHQQSYPEGIGAIKKEIHEEIGRKIAKRCDGLPLAAVEYGALLRISLDPYDWNYVLESHVQETAYEVLASLKLSYNFLSDPLKRCFQYCSIFPKKSILEKKMVVQLWIAADLLRFSSTNQEKVGEEYFDELVSRSLIHRRSIGDDERNFRMHNFIHDLTIEVTPSEVFSPCCTDMDKHNREYKMRNFSYIRGTYDSYDKFDKLQGVKGLRIFLAFPLQEQLPLSLLSSKVLNDLLPRMRQLLVLSLSNYKSITKVPYSIGNLLNLQYLNLSHTNIERLPSVTCKLYYLQFLLLAGCKRFTELPKDMGKLIKLRHLDISNTALRELPEDVGKLINLSILDISNTALREMPVQIAKLENLHTLSDFVVSKHNGGLNIADLGKLDLHGKLSISQLQNVNDPSEVDRANIKMKEQIDELALEWDCGITFLDLQIQSVVLEKLQPSTSLKSLTIKGYAGISFPNWLGDSLFSNIVYLRISNCTDCLWLPPLGQLGNLKELVIEGMQSVETIGLEFYGSDSSSFQLFPSLETLQFEDMPVWEEWNLIVGTATEFPSLKSLSLSKCPKLMVGNIIDKFSSLTELVLRECSLLEQSIPSSHHVFKQLMFPLNPLRHLTIDGFPSLISFPTDGLPKTLKVLIISNCENLEFLTHDYLHNYTSLEELKISYSCSSMISFTLGTLPVLKSLFIEGCINLKSILIAEDESEKSLSFLRSIKIWDCNELESFPPGELATPNLVYIALWKCEKLHSLPEAMNSLAGLQEMEIDNLPNLQSFVIDELPSSLRKLSVGPIGGIMWNTEPTWEHLTCLSELRINGDDVVNTLMGPLLPTSLVKLCICGLNDTSIDEKWLQHLTSLQNLEIINAPKLKLLPKKGFPSSLSILSVTRCPLLEAILRNKWGKEWRKIAHIPSIIIDDELIT